MPPRLVMLPVVFAELAPADRAASTFPLATIGIPALPAAPGQRPAPAPQGRPAVLHLGTGSEGTGCNDGRASSYLTTSSSVQCETPEEIAKALDGKTGLGSSAALVASHHCARDLKLDGHSVLRHRSVSVACLIPPPLTARASAMSLTCKEVAGDRMSVKADS